MCSRTERRSGLDLVRAGWLALVVVAAALPAPAGAVESADLDQCGNGTFETPLICEGARWINGNVNASSAHFWEGDSISYRIKFSGLVVSSSNEVAIEWDTTKAGKHAVDYLTSFDRTDQALTCSGVAGCQQAIFSTFPIPADPNVSGAGVAQEAGLFTIWGGSITGVSAYTLSGTYAGDSSTRITITFTALQPNPVLAWGGHLARPDDWESQGGTAVTIAGSPYHSRLLGLNGGGSLQDRALSSTAVRLDSKVTIVKQTVPEGDPQDFEYFASGLEPQTFVLDDDASDSAHPQSMTFDRLLIPLGTGEYVVDELPVGPWWLPSGEPACEANFGATSTVDPYPAGVSITLEYGDRVVCTFTSTQVADLIFGDGFASGDTSAWSNAFPRD